MGIAVTSEVMSKLTIALIAVLFCITLAEVSEKQSVENEALSEILNDHNLVKREADPNKKKKNAAKKRNKRKKKCPNGKKCRKAINTSKKGKKAGKRNQRKGK